MTREASRRSLHIPGRDVNGTLLLDRHTVAEFLPMQAYIAVVEDAFRLHADGKTLGTALLHVDGVDGEFHVKAGGLHFAESYFGIKINGGFFHNRERFGLPNIQGLILLSNARNGVPLALMDSAAITRNRTGAATAVAARYLARPDSHRVTICGAGTQGRVQLEALSHVLPIESVQVYSRSDASAKRFATEMSAALGLNIRATSNLENALGNADVVVTCTPARGAFIRASDIQPGTFVAAVGADSPDKQELESTLLATSRVVADILDQSATVGELHHALELGVTDRSKVSELGDIITGRAPGRTSAEEIIIFDSTGTALQDVAAAVAVYQKAIANKSMNNTSFDFTA